MACIPAFTLICNDISGSAFLFKCEVASSVLSFILRNGKSRKFSQYDFTLYPTQIGNQNPESFELQLVVISQISVMVQGLYSNDRILYGGKNVSITLLPRARDCLIRHRVVKPKMLLLSSTSDLTKRLFENEVRTDSSTSMWKKAVANKKAKYLPKYDRYRLL